MSYSKSVENTIPLINSAVATYTIESNVRVYMGKGSEKKDAGQSYLPFFDSQNIELTIPAPLSGLQLIYYNTPEYGGFIRPRISSINYLDYLLTTANYTTAEEYDGDSKKINGRSGDWSEINLPLQSSAKVWTVMMPVIFISSIFSFYSRKYI